MLWLYSASKAERTADRGLDMCDLTLAANDVVGAEVGAIAEWVAVEFNSDAYRLTWRPIRLKWKPKIRVARGGRIMRAGYCGMPPPITMISFVIVGKSSLLHCMTGHFVRAITHASRTSRTRHCSRVS